jgi:hypothetical protein
MESDHGACRQPPASILSHFHNLSPSLERSPVACSLMLCRFQSITVLIEIHVTLVIMRFSMSTRGALSSGFRFFCPDDALKRLLPTARVISPSSRGRRRTPELLRRYISRRTPERTLIHRPRDPASGTCTSAQMTRPIASQP